MAKLDPELAMMITDMYQVIHAMNPTTDMTDLGKWLDSRMATHEKNAQQLTQKEIAERSKEFKRLIDSMGLATKSTDKLVLEMTKALQAREQQGTKVSKAMQTNAFDELLRKLYAQYSRTTQNNRTAVNPKMPFASFGSSTARSNQSTQRLQQIVSQNNFGNFWDKATEKLLGLFTSPQVRQEKRRFIDNFVEALGKNKFIGGAFRDSVKLMSLLGASWLRQFGTLGKALGVALIAAAPFIAQTMGTIIGNLLSKAVSHLLLQTLAGKGVVGTIGRAGVTAAGSWVLGAWADKEKEAGNTGVSRAARTSSVALGVASIAQLVTPVLSALIPALAPILAPIAPIALAVAGIAAAIGGIIKYHKQIGESFKILLDKLNIPRIMDEFGKAFSDKVHNIIHPDSKNNGPYSKEYHYGPVAQAVAGGEGIKKSAITVDALKVASQTKAKIDPNTGAITNFAKMTKEQGQREMEAYRKSNPEDWNNLYEIVPKELVSMASFSTDLAAPDGSGVYAGKGTTERLKELRAAVQKEGGDPNKVLMTSGIGSMGSYNEQTGAYTVTPHNPTGSLLSHTSPYGTGMDVSLGGLSAKKMESITRQLFNLSEKGAKEEGDHIDLKFGETGEAIKAREAIAARKSIKVRTPEETKKAEDDIIEEMAEDVEKSKFLGEQRAKLIREHKELFREPASRMLQQRDVDAAGNRAYAKSSKLLSDISWMVNQGISNA